MADYFVDHDNGPERTGIDEDRREDATRNGLNALAFVRRRLPSPLDTAEVRPMARCTPGPRLSPTE